MRDRIDALRAVYARWAEGDFRAGAELLAPDLEYWADPERTLYRGPEGMRAYMTDFLSSWSDFRLRALEFREAGDEVLVLQEQEGGSDTVGRMSARTGAIWTFRDGHVVRIRQYFDPREALGEFDREER